MRRLAIAGCVLAVAGCGGGEARVPAGCSAGAGSITRALADAPGPVRLDGTPISGCFTRSAGADAIQVVGGDLVVVAQHLGDLARDGDEDAALQLGYLVGAVRRAADQSGVVDELARRIEQEPGALASSSDAYRRGLRAGRADG